MKKFLYSSALKAILQEYFKIHADNRNHRGKRKAGVYDLICTFDTETSVNHKIKDEKKFAYIILWQFDINNDLLFYGRDIKSYVNFITDVQDALKQNLVVYVHNLSYEFQFIKFYFKWDDVFFMTPRKVYRAKDRKLIYKDSYALSGQSLEKTVEKYPIKKAVGDWDYEKIRTPMTPLSNIELNYAFNDVISLQYYINDMKQQYKVLERIPMTKTGITRFNLREFLKKYYSGKGNFKTGYEFYYNTFLKHSIPDLDIYEKLQRVYWGGFTHANLFNSHKTLKNVESYDICSSYPTVMLCEKFPFKFYKENPKRFNYYYNSEDYAVIAKYRFFHLQSKIKMGYISTYKVEDKTNDFIFDNGKIYKCYDEGDGILEIWLNEIDFKTICNIYDFDKVEIISDEIYVSKKHYLPDGFREFILEMYAQKTMLKGVNGKQEMYSRAKADLNSLYGMTVTAPIRYKYKLENRDIIEYLEDTEENLLDKAYRQKSHPVGLYQWGVYVAAYARRNLMKVIEKIDPNDFIYSDTDSIKVKNGYKYENLITNYNKEITSKLKIACKNLSHTTDPETVKGVKKPLGVYEHEFTADFFKCLRSKTYIYTIGSENFATVAGISKNDMLNALEKRAYENGTNIYIEFDDDLYIPADELTKVTAYYNDERHDDNVDGVVVSSESSTILEKIDFSIQGDSYYLRVISEIQNYSGKIIKK